MMKMPALLASPIDGRAVLRLAFLASVIVTVLPYGSVYPFFGHLAAALQGALAAAGLFIPIANPALSRLFRSTLLLTLALVGWVLAQAAFFAGNPLAHPIWATANGLTGGSGGSLSVAPGETLAALPALITPLLVFLNGLVLVGDERDARQLWLQLSFFGAIVAGVALLQFVLLPKTLLIGEKEFYRDSLTAVFVNRNNAATFLGLALVGLAALLVQQWRDLEHKDLLRRLYEIDPRRRDRYFRFFATAGAAAIVLLALFLTKSRAGIGASFVALVFISVLVARTRRGQNMTAVKRLGLIALQVLAIALVFLTFSSRTILRLEESGLDDPRWCSLASVREAIADQPLGGTGFGTFEQVFPLYRSIECGIAGVLDRAHNSYLEGYLGLGLPFAIAVTIAAILILPVLMHGYRTRRRQRSFPISTMAAVLLAALHSSVDFPLQIAGVSTYFAALLAAGTAISLGRNSHPDP